MILQFLDLMLHQEFVFFLFLQLLSDPRLDQMQMQFLYLLYILVNSINLSDVGSGPLEQPKSSLFMTSTSHPIFFNKVAAKSFAAPPPLSIAILGRIFYISYDFSCIFYVC